MSRSGGRFSERRQPVRLSGPDDPQDLEHRSCRVRVRHGDGLEGRARSRAAGLADSYSGGGDYTTTILEYDIAYRPLRTQVTLPAVGDLASLTKRDFVTEFSYTADGQIKTVKLPQITKGGAKDGGANVLGAETVTTYYDAASRAQWMAGGFGWGDLRRRLGA